MVSNYFGTMDFRGQDGMSKQCLHYFSSIMHFSWANGTSPMLQYLEWEVGCTALIVGQPSYNNHKQMSGSLPIPACGNLKTLEPPTMKPPKLKPAKILKRSKFAVYALKIEILFWLKYHRTYPNIHFSSIICNVLHILAGFITVVGARYRIVIEKVKWLFGWVL